MSQKAEPPVRLWDAHNQKLATNVHPADWRNPTQAEAIRKSGDLYNRTRLTPFVKSLMNG